MNSTIKTKKMILFSVFLFLVTSLLLLNETFACDPCGGRNPGAEWCENGKKYRCVWCSPDCDCNGDGVKDNCCENQRPVCDRTCTQPENMYQGRGKFTVEVGACDGDQSQGERVVGRVVLGLGTSNQLLSGVRIYSADGKIAQWGVNAGGPYYHIGRWPAPSSVTITVEPPSGAYCDRWTFDPTPAGAIGGEISGSGCSATIFIVSGPFSPDWQNHLWFYLKSCNNECTSAGQVEKRCLGNNVQKRICGNYDADPCLEWSSWENEEDCASQGKVCKNGKCIKQECSRNLDCPKGYFCEFPVGTCSPPGTCVPIPTICFTLLDPVCGCDNKTYSNDCFRAMAKVSKKHHGECAVVPPPPLLVDLKVNNSDGPVTLSYSQRDIVLSWLAPSMTFYRCEANTTQKPLASKVDWSGPKPLTDAKYQSETLRLDVAGTYKFTLTCWYKFWWCEGDERECAEERKMSDSVVVYLQKPSLLVITRGVVISY